MMTPSRQRPDGWQAAILFASCLRARGAGRARQRRAGRLFTDDLYTRQEPGAAIILILTRWHLDDWFCDGRA